MKHSLDYLVDQAESHLVFTLPAEDAPMPRDNLTPRGHEPTRLVKYKKESAERRRQAISVVPVGALGLALAAGSGSMLGLGEQAVPLLRYLPGTAPESPRVPILWD